MILIRLEEGKTVGPPPVFRRRRRVERWMTDSQLATSVSRVDSQSRSKIPARLALGIALALFASGLFLFLWQGG
jgi:hypothetical protein